MDSLSGIRHRRGLVSINEFASACAHSGVTAAPARDYTIDSTMDRRFKQPKASTFEWRDTEVRVRIPKVIHQLWKVEEIPTRWHHASASVRKYHRGWEYRLWTDAMMDAHVRAHHPGFHPIYAGMNRNIMRADVFRYVLMHDIGGL